MKFKFKVQEYQTEAVKSVVDVFKGQPYKERSEYTLDTGVQIQQNYQTAMFDKNREGFVSQYDEDYDLCRQHLPSLRFQKGCYPLSGAGGRKQHPGHR
jgi:hypothetical protein